MTKQRNLSVLALKKMDASLNIKERIYLDDDYYLDMDKNFRNSRIAIIAERLLEVNQYLAENKIDKFDIISYSFLLLIKEFTSLKIENNLIVELKTLEILIDLNYFEKIIKYFGDENLKFFMDKLTEVLNNVGMIQNKIVEEIMKKEKENIDGDMVEDIKDKVVNVNEGDENLESPATIETDRIETTE